MDVTLERILSLLPRKDNGDFVRGAKKDFATSIGYDSGDIVSLWISGASSSYKKKLHTIALEYGVSVEWLLGETETKKPVTDGDELDATTKELRDIWESADDDERKALLEMARLIRKRRG